MAGAASKITFKEMCLGTVQMWHAAGSSQNVRASIAFRMVFSPSSPNTLLKSHRHTVKTLWQQGPGTLTGWDPQDHHFGDGFCHGFGMPVERLLASKSKHKIWFV